ncbi:hypothetical protein PspLS_09394 [Pyricularia sp. CBS 133598]|nr:hypothetical protein PspLS_09394 [Pyricularia sp. CBS 133598]
MRFDIIAILSLATLATATSRKSNPFQPVSLKGLKKCQAACVSATIGNLGHGNIAIMSTPAKDFCSQPDLKLWLVKEVFPCGQVTCGRKVRLYAKRGMKWLRKTCPGVTFVEADFMQPAPQSPANVYDDEDANAVDVNDGDDY